VNTDVDVTISKKSIGGAWAPGTVQYFVTYVNKYGQESNIVYTSPLYYLTAGNEDAIGEDEIASVSFDIDVKNNVYLNCYLHENPPIAFTKELARPAVVVCPGGGYSHLSEREADPVALEYLAKGYNAFVLYYSLNEAATFPKPIVDLSKALKIIRENADEWHIIKDKIAVCGFSAGDIYAPALAFIGICPK
jgi:acetyl esterase/lipase